MSTSARVVIVGAGPTGITAATLLAQYGVDSLVLDRWTDVYPQPRAVHLDDEIFRIVARLGIADEFAAISRPAYGLRLLDNTMRVLAEFRRDTACSVNGFPQANMFDQPEFEVLLRNNLKRYPHATLRGDADVTAIEDRPDGRARVTFTDRTDGREHTVDADYVLGCDGANSVVRTEIGSTMRDLRFEQRWLVVDVGTDVDLDQWEGVHQVCDPVRAGTYMRIGDSRLPMGVPAAARRNRRGLREPGRTQTAHRTLDITRQGGRARADPRHRVHVPGADRRQMATRQRLSARRRRPPHPAVHRPGHGRRAARRDEPVVEAGRRACRRPPSWRSGQLRAGAKATHPRPDPARSQRRPVDDCRWRVRQSDSPRGRSADAPHPRPARQGRRQQNACAAPLCAGPPITSPAATDGHALPEPAAARRPSTRRDSRARVRNHLGCAR